MSDKTYNRLKEIFLIIAIIGAVLLNIAPTTDVAALFTWGTALSSAGAAGLEILSITSKRYFSDKVIVGPEDIDAEILEELKK